MFRNLLIVFGIFLGITVQAHDEIQLWCEQAGAEIKRLNWKLAPCKGIPWKIGGKSVNGRPLVYAEFGDPAAQNTTLIFSTVHGDEITPFFIGVQVAHWMQENSKKFPTSYVIIAPLVNPDGFFKQKRTRVNARGVDINRNFATQDWDAKAVKAWKIKFHTDPRRFPGSKSGSEPETVFQQELIQKLKPQKILSIHAPLNFLDYDGPSTLSLAKFPKDYVQECMKLRARLKAISSGFFPGSLGNYAGQELGIPTLTLELPTANPKKANQYWEKFKIGIHTMIEFKVPNYAARARKQMGS